MGANIGGDGLSSPSSPGLSRGPIAALLETLVPGTSAGMTGFAAISHYFSAHGVKAEDDRNGVAGKPEAKIFNWGTSCPFSAMSRFHTSPCSKPPEAEQWHA